MSSPFKLLVISVLLLFLLPVFIPWVSASSEDVATLSITQAEETLASAFEAVLEAEQAEANVFENASRFADLCFEVVGDVGGEAVGLRDEAERLGEADFVVKMFGSVGGVIVVVFFGFCCLACF